MRSSEYNEPVYTIGIVARKLGVCAATLRIWERKGLLTPARLGKDRFYSDCDLDRLRHIKRQIQVRGINIEGVKAMLADPKCWEINKCLPADRSKCKVYRQQMKR
jgi:MerR family transcriptional regulator, heat shock protein HspR